MHIARASVYFSRPGNRQGRPAPVSADWESRWMPTRKAGGCLLGGSEGWRARKHARVRAGACACACVRACVCVCARVRVLETCPASDKPVPLPLKFPAMVRGRRRPSRANRVGILRRLDGSARAGPRPETRSCGPAKGECTLQREQERG